VSPGKHALRVRWAGRSGGEAVSREIREVGGDTLNTWLGRFTTLPATGAIPIAIGSNIGTTSTGLLASLSMQQTARRTALANLSISAIVVGGNSLFGGQGGIGNTITGLLVLGVLNNGLDHISIDSFLKILIRGLILLLALVINVYAQRVRNSG
jgi:ribose transport system permease protein